MYGAVIIVLLIVILAHQHMQMRLIRSVGTKLGVADQSPMELLFGPKKMPAEVVALPDVPATNSTTSGFTAPLDFMAHARKMDQRTGTPASKTEALIMNNDRAQRKLRAALVKGG